MRIPEEEIEEFLHTGQETHTPGCCGNCGGPLREMVEVWCEEDKAYHVKEVIDVAFAMRDKVKVWDEDDKAHHIKVDIDYAKPGGERKFIQIINNGGIVNVSNCGTEAS